MRPVASRALQVLLPFLIPFWVGVQVHRQGFNLLDDGLWLLGTRILVEGGTLYGDIFSIYGPARYLLLAPFFLALGKSALTLAIFKACLDGTAGLFGYWYTRWLGSGRWAWLVPVGVAALGPVYPRYLAAAVFAAMVGGVLARAADRRRSLLLGMAWGSLGLFGLDMAGYGAVILIGGWLFSRWFSRGSTPVPVLQLAPVTGGLAIVGGTAALVFLVLGVLETAFWDTVIYPATRFNDAMGVSWYESFMRDPLLRDPFSGHFTGEILGEGWPGHLWQKVVGFRFLFILAWLMPVSFLFFLRRSGDVRFGPLAALAFAGWATLLARGDIFHLRLICFALLLLVPVLVSRWRAGPVVTAPIVGTLFLISLGPLLGEQIWLATHLDRPGLVKWERETAKIHLDARRMSPLEALCSELPWDGVSPVLVWPAQPGLQFVLAAPLATAQSTLLAGEVRDTGEVMADLEASRPPVLVLGSARGLVKGVTNLRSLEPALHRYLRTHYERKQEYLPEGETFLVGARVPENGQQGPATGARLPGVSQEMASSATAVIGPGVSLAQTFRVEDFDLEAVEIVFRSPGPFPYPISFILTIHELAGSSGTRQLMQTPIQISLEKPTQKIMFSFPALRQSVGKLLLLEVSGNPQRSRPFSLLWNQSTEENPIFVDFFPEGQAFQNFQPRQADLFFVTY